MAQVSLHDREHRCADALDPQENRTPYQHSPQRTHYGQCCDCSCKAIRRIFGKRHQPSQVTSDEQVVTSGQYRAHEHRSGRVAGEIYVDSVGTVLNRNAARPVSQIAGQLVERWIGQEQHPLAGDIHVNPLVDQCFQTRGPFAVKDVSEPLRIGTEHLRPPVLDSNLPCVPQRRGEQYQGDDTEGDIAERQRERRRSQESSHPRSTCSRRYVRCAAGAARSRHRSSAAGC